MSDYKLHAVIISNDVPLEESRKIAQEFIKDKNKTFYRITENKKSVRWRNIAKKKFKPSSFRTKIIKESKPHISLIFGQLK